MLGHSRRSHDNNDKLALKSSEKIIWYASIFFSIGALYIALLAIFLEAFISAFMVILFTEFVYSLIYSLHLIYSSVYFLAY
jgi:hypothetical protein